MTSLSMEDADLDDDGHPDAAIVAGGRILILHATGASGGAPWLEATSLPITASAVAVGSFVHDRAWRRQMAVLDTGGNLQVVVHGQFDPRGWSKAEGQAMRDALLHGQPNPFQRSGSSPILDGWRVLETFSTGFPANDPSHPPLLMRVRLSGYASDDVLAISPTNGLLAMISHANVGSGASTFIAGQLSSRSCGSGLAVAALPARVNVDARGGVVLLERGQKAPAVMMPVPDPIFFPNRFDDIPPRAAAVTCLNSTAADNSNDCTLREAVIKANATAGPDTIMLSAGTYTLSIPGQGLFDATTGHLDLSDTLSIVGTGSTSTIIKAEQSTNDTVFMIGVLDANGEPLNGIDTAIQNLAVQGGQALSATGSPTGGGVHWEAGLDGTGSLTLTDVTFSGNVAVDPALPQVDVGGGLSLSNVAGIQAAVTISGSTFANNVAAGSGGGLSVQGLVRLDMGGSTTVTDNKAMGAGNERGGGVFLDTGGRGVSALSNIHEGVQILRNTAGDGQGQGRGGGIWTSQSVNISGTVLANNISGAGGGVLAHLLNPDAAVAINATTITENQAVGGNGGGVEVDTGTNAAALTMTFNRIVGNSVTGANQGGGFNNDGSGMASGNDNWWGCSEGPLPVSGNSLPISVFGTGVTSTGALGADGAIDTHYSLTASNDRGAPGPSTFIANTNAFPIPPWQLNGPASKWIAPLSNAAAGLNPGIYIYETTFDLTGLDPQTAQLSGKWGADNALSVLVNGNSAAVSGVGFQTLTDFGITGGFVPGVNTLDFVVTNMGTNPNPTGFRTDLSGTARSKTSCDTAIGKITASPWITLTNTATPSIVAPGVGTTLTASLAQDSAGTPLPTGNLSAMQGIPVTFGNAVHGTLSNAAIAIGMNATASALFTPSLASTTASPKARADVQLDHATATASIAVADFALTASPSLQTINPGTAKASFKILVSGMNGFKGPVGLVVTFSSGLSTRLSSTSIIGSGAVTLRVNTTTAAPATYSITLQGSTVAGNVGFSHSVSVQLVVADFGVSISPTTPTNVPPGGGAPYTISVSSANGFSGALTLSPSGLPANTVTFATNPIILSGQLTSASSSMKVTAPSGTYNFGVALPAPKASCAPQFKLC